MFSISDMFIIFGNFFPGFPCILQKEIHFIGETGFIINIVMKTLAFDASC